MGGDKSSSQKLLNYQPRRQCFKGEEWSFRGRESAASIPSHHVFTSCHVVASRSTRFVCSFIHSFVCLVGCCIVSLPLVVVSCPTALPRHVVVLRLVSHRPARFVVIESLCRRISSRVVPPLSSHDVDIDTLVAHLPLMARCLLGDVYECICFGLVTVKNA